MLQFLGNFKFLNYHSVCLTKGSRSSWNIEEYNLFLLQNDELIDDAFGKYEHFYPIDDIRDFERFRVTLYVFVHRKPITSTP